PVIARQISRPDPDRVAVADLDRAALAGIGRVVIIGNGIAGITAAEDLRRLSSTIAITLLTAEPHAHYNRMAIARLMTGAETLASLSLLP
ncbi:FAD-dependent oxidoreductase, partial [Acinetobacter baumannii]